MTATSERKLAENRLKMLTFAETLGNVSEACRKLGISRSQFYEYKKRFEQHGLDGLRDLPPIHKTHPQTTPPVVVEQILALSYEQPGWGCQKVSAKLKQQGCQITDESGSSESLVLQGKRRTMGTCDETPTSSLSIPWPEKTRSHLLCPVLPLMGWMSTMRC